MGLELSGDGGRAELLGPVPNCEHPAYLAEGWPGLSQSG
jgi:hypothetical protein